MPRILDIGVGGKSFFLRLGALSDQQSPAGLSAPAYHTLYTFYSEFSRHSFRDVKLALRTHCAIMGRPDSSERAPDSPFPLRVQIGKKSLSYRNLNICPCQVSV